MFEVVTKSDNKRGLLQMLRDKGLTDYGSDIPTELVHEELGITMPMYASKSVFDGLSMLELAAVDYCRNVLLGEGKYLQGTRTGYRVLLPSENKGQVDAYMRSADSKLSRALKLSRNSAASNDVANSQIEARIMLKKSGARRGPGYSQQQAAA